MSEVLEPDDEDLKLETNEDIWYWLSLMLDVLLGKDK